MALQLEFGMHFPIEMLMQMVIEIHQEGKGEYENNQLQDQRDHRVLVLPFTCCVSLGKLLKLSELWFPLTWSCENQILEIISIKME